MTQILDENTSINTENNIKIVNNQLWFSVSEAAKLGGVNTKTIRRAIQSNKISYKIKGNRYSINLASLIQFLHTNKKLTNKFNDYGIGQYVEKWFIK